MTKMKIWNSQTGSFYLAHDQSPLTYMGTVIILITGYSKDANAYKKVGNLDKRNICMSPLKMFACLC